MNCLKCGQKREKTTLMLPDDVWNKIKPLNTEGGGSLCAYCIIDKLDDMGWSGWKMEMIPDEIMSNEKHKDILKNISEVNKNTINRIYKETERIR